MSVLRNSSLSLLVLAALGCGGADPLPPPPPPPPAMPKNVLATGPGASDAGVEPTPEAPVLLVSGAAAPEPTGPAPTVRITAPTRGQIITAAKAADFGIKLDIKHWPLAKEGAQVAFVLDGKPAKSIDDAKRAIKLGELSTSPLAEGHHVLSAVLTRATHETLKSKDAHFVTDFWVGSRTTATVDLKKPLLIVSRPLGAYDGADADHVLVDFLVTGIELGDGKGRVGIKLEGPGIDGALRATTTRVVPYYLENLHAGTYSLHTEILGPDGKPLDAPGASVTTSVVVTRAASPSGTSNSFGVARPASASPTSKNATDAGAATRAESVPPFVPTPPAASAAADAGFPPVRGDKPKPKPKP